MSRKQTVIVVEPEPHLAVAVEALLSSVRPTPELVAVADIAELREWATETGVVVAGPSCATKKQIGALRLFREDHPGLRIILAFDRRPGSPMADVIAIGADSMVDPDNMDHLLDELHRSIDLSERLMEIVELGKHVEDGAMGQVFPVCSATGGCGKTFFSSNLAFALARLTNKKVALVDLDLQFGEVLTAMRIRAQHTIADAIDIKDDEELRDYLPDLMTAHESGVWVLPAPLDPGEADWIQPQDVGRVIQALQYHYDYVIVDNPTGLGEITLAAMDGAAQLFVLAALDLSSVRNMRLFMQTLDRLHIPEDDVSLILNKDQDGVGIDADDIERLFPNGFKSRIPFDREVPRSMNAGMPVLASAPKSMVSHLLVDGIKDFLPEGARRQAERSFPSPEPMGFFARRRKRRREKKEAKLASDTSERGGHVAPATS